MHTAPEAIDLHGLDAYCEDYYNNKETVGLAGNVAQIWEYIEDNDSVAGFDEGGA